MVDDYLALETNRQRNNMNTVRMSENKADVNASQYRSMSNERKRVVPGLVPGAGSYEWAFASNQG